MLEKHIPVLLDEVLVGLNLHEGQTIIDATIGLGGHAKAILEQLGSTGKLIGFDRDERNLEQALFNLSEFGKRVTLIHDSFGAIAEHDLQKVDGVLFDLGFSSVDDPSRGFSFQQEGPLDMRYDRQTSVTAEQIVNGYSQEQLADIIYVFGEEPKSRIIAKAITVARKRERIKTTIQLANIIESVAHRSGRIHPATKTFQALRMVVNDELGEIEKGLGSAIDITKQMGRICVITFHSLEDRLVKQFFTSRTDINIINKHVIVPNYDETRLNPRSRSAKLRIVQKR